MIVWERRTWCHGYAFGLTVGFFLGAVTGALVLIILIAKRLI